MTWQALDMLARDTVKDFQELADEAFADLLRKHGRPVGLKAALSQSAGQSGSVTHLTPHKGTGRFERRPIRKSRNRTRPG